MFPLLIDGDQGAPTYLFAHGAGAMMDSEFMSSQANLIAQRGVRVVRFEFPYMQQVRATGKRRPPDRQLKLIDAFTQVLDSLSVDMPVIGGKSMGGRMATHVAIDRPVAGVALLGYPFHPQGKPEKVRIDHLQHIKCPVYICQGERDTMGSRTEVAAYDLPEKIKIDWLADGDHDLKPRKSSGECYQQHMVRAAKAVSDFVIQASANAKL